MNVETAIQTLRSFPALVQRLVGKGKGGMEAKEAMDHVAVIGIGLTDESGILLNSFPCGLSSVSIRGLIAEAGTDAQIPGSLCYGT